MDKTIEQQLRAEGGRMSAENRTIEQQAREILAMEMGLAPGTLDLYDGFRAPCRVSVALRAIARALTRPAPTEAEVEASSLLKMIATEYLSVQPFDMPTGQGDADIGWQVMAPEGKVLAEVFSDNLLTALRMARAALGKERG